jgi:aristolochene synthase
MQQFQKACIWKRLTNGCLFQKRAMTFTRPILSPDIYRTRKPTRQYSTASNIPCEIPPSQLESKTHPLGWEKIQAQVEPYFGNNWSFASEKEKRGFLALGLSRAFSHFFPLTLDDRIDLTCKILYMSLLIDGEFYGD